MKMVKEGVTKSLKPLCPYQKVEAETMAWSEKMKSAYNPQVGVFITALADGAYTKVRASKKAATPEAPKEDNLPARL